VKAGLISVYGTDNLSLLMQFWFEYSGSRWRVGDFERIVAITSVEAKLSRSGALGTTRTAIRWDQTLTSSAAKVSMEGPLRSMTIGRSND
jgi:hypothetical protein